MWASNVSTRVVVTTQVEWSGRSFIKGELIILCVPVVGRLKLLEIGIIEKSCLDGQRTYHVDLDKGVRGYIQSHLSEFVPEGVTEAEAVVTRAVAAAAPEPVSSLGTPSELTKGGHRAGNQRGLQWAYDTFEGAFDVAKKSAETAFELLGDALDSYSSLSWSHVVIFLLVITNVWTIWKSNGRGEARVRKEMLRNEERERWVKEAVMTLWQELAKNGGMISTSALPLEPPRPEVTEGGSGSWKDDVDDISRVLDELQARLDGLKAALKEVRAQPPSQDSPQGSLSDLD